MESDEGSLRRIAGGNSSGSPMRPIRGADRGRTRGSRRASGSVHGLPCRAGRAAIRGWRPPVAAAAPAVSRLRREPGGAARRSLRLARPARLAMWTFRLAPIALAIFLIAVFAGSSSTSSSTPGAAETATATLDTWTRGVNEASSVAAAVWQDRTSSDALLETMLLGGSSGVAGGCECPIAGRASGSRSSCWPFSASASRPACCLDAAQWSAAAPAGPAVCRTARAQGPPGARRGGPPPGPAARAPDRDLQLTEDQRSRIGVV